MTTSLVWFRRDLRLHDNPALAAAVAASKTVYAVFCSEDMAMLNARQRVFVASALRHLRSALGKNDATLTVLDGDCASAIESAARRLGASAVLSARAFDRRERAS